MNVSKLSDLLKLEYGKPLDKSDRTPGSPYKAYGANGPISDASKYLVKGPGIIVGRKGSAGEITEVSENFWPLDVTYFVKHDAKETDLKFLYYLLLFSDLKQFVRGVKPGLNRNDAYELVVPFPSLPEQKAIVEKLNAAFAEIDDLERNIALKEMQCKSLFESVVDTKLQALIQSARVVKLKTVVQIARGGSPRPIKSFITDDPNGVPWIKIGDATSSTKYIEFTAQMIKRSGIARSRLVHPGDFILSNSMSFGRPYIMSIEGCIHDGWLVLSDSERNFDQDYLYFLLGSQFVFQQFDRLAAGSTVRNLNIELAGSIDIPVPSLDVQKRLSKEFGELETEISVLRLNVEESARKVQSLRNSILSSAFTEESNVA